jgi:hypothetical protein
VKSIELVELDLESVKVELESAHKRIGAGNTKKLTFLLTFFWWYFAFFGAKGGSNEKKLLNESDRGRRVLLRIGDITVGISS